MWKKKFWRARKETWTKDKITHERHWIIVLHMEHEQETGDQRGSNFTEHVIIIWQIFFFFLLGSSPVRPFTLAFMWRMFNTWSIPGSHRVGFRCCCPWFHRQAFGKLGSIKSSYSGWYYIYIPGPKFCLLSQWYLSAFHHGLCLNMQHTAGI